MNRAHKMFAAVLCFAVTAIFLAVPHTLLAADAVEVWKCGKDDHEGGRFACWCFWNSVTKQSRKVCNEGGDCWTDTGWTAPGGGGDVMPDPGGSLPVNYNSAGDMLISVAPGEGGNFFGTGNPHCLGFTSNTSNLLVMPAPLLQ